MNPKVIIFQEFSSGDPTAPGSPSDLVLDDLNPCLTPYYVKAKSKVENNLKNSYQCSYVFGDNTCMG